MCGIFFSCCASPKLPSLSLQRRLRQRGPDSFQSISRSVGNESTEHGSTFRLTAASSVLSVRGAKVIHQPIFDESDQAGSFLLWNGEAWRFDGKSIEEHDAQFVFYLLLAATKSSSGNPRTELTGLDNAQTAVFTVLGNIAGPFAFVFYDGHNGRFYYGRDTLGRRSLLIRKSSHALLQISSICDEHTRWDWAEVAAAGIYVVDLHKIKSHKDNRRDFADGLNLPEPVLIPWQHHGQLITEASSVTVRIGDFVHVCADRT